jgi:hypothetical protein
MSVGNCRSVGPMGVVDSYGVKVVMRVPRKMSSGLNRKAHNQCRPNTIEPAMEHEQRPTSKSGRPPTRE